MISRIALKAAEYALAVIIVGVGISAVELTMLGAFRNRN